MKAKIENLHELYKLMRQKDRVASDLFTLFGLFGLGHILRRLSLEKQSGVSAVQLILSLCLFRINGQSVHSVYTKDFYGLLETGKNCYYRMLNRSRMDWRSLLLRMSTRYEAILRKRGSLHENQPHCYIIDDTTLEKSGLKMEGISRVFDHVKGCCVLGYKLLLLAYFDGCSTIPVDFSIHREKGSKKDYGLTDRQRKDMYSRKRSEEDPDKARFKECDKSKLACAIEMIKRVWKAGLKAEYALCNSWFTCEELIHEIRRIGKGAVHFVGLGKMSRTKYMVCGRNRNVHELIRLYERQQAHYCRKYHCRYISLKGTLGKEPVRIFLIKYGRNKNWNILITSDLSLNFIQCFELYQIRWNIEVLIKENRQYLGLGGYQGRDFDGQIADCTLCFITHIVLSLDKRFTDYETMGELFADQREDIMALTLWRRTLALIENVLAVMAELIEVSPEQLLENLMAGDKIPQEYHLMFETLKRQQDENKGVA